MGPQNGEAEDMCSVTENSKTLVIAVTSTILLVKVWRLQNLIGYLIIDRDNYETMEDNKICTPPVNLRCVGNFHRLFMKGRNYTVC